MSRASRFSFFSLLVCLSFTAVAAVSPARLISPYFSIEKGLDVPIGILISIEKGWHTYWKNPGEIGDSLKVHWSLSPALPVSDLSWPRPRRIPYGKWVNFGYTEDVLLSSRLFFPETQNASALHITARVKWLVCEKLCIPRQETLSLLLPVEAQARINPAEAQLFKQNKEKQNSPHLFKGFIEKQKNNIKLTFQSNFPFEWVDFFPVDSSFSFTKKPRLAEQTEKSAVLSLDAEPHSTPLLKKALIVFKKEGKTYSSEIPVKKNKNILKILFYCLTAFLGGLILNAMPCVLPVVFLKFYHLIDIKKQTSRKNLIFSSFSYGGGVVCFFLALAFLIHLLSEGFLGWGFQMRSPVFVSLLVVFFSLLGFSFLDLFKTPSFLKAKAGSLKSSLILENFISGGLAVLAASPCTAPFMGAAIGYAFSQSMISVFLIFTSLGLGLAFPYFILCFWPNLLKSLPLPDSAWSLKLKKSMAFLMFASAGWLIHILIGLQAEEIIFPLLLSLIGLAFSFWIWGAKPISKGASFLAFSASLFLLIFSLLFILKKEAEIKKNGADDFLQEQKIIKNKSQFSIARLNELRKSGRPVFVSFTAKWCLTCKVNEWGALRDKKFLLFLKEHNSAWLEGDWTRASTDIEQTLKKYNRAGIPFTLFFPPGKEQPIIFPEILTAKTLIQEISSALKKN